MPARWSQPWAGRPGADLDLSFIVITLLHIRLQNPVADHVRKQDLASGAADVPFWQCHGLGEVDRSSGHLEFRGEVDPDRTLASRQRLPRLPNTSADSDVSPS